MSGTENEQRLAVLVADLEIRRLVHEYAAAIDARDWPRLDQVFAREVVVSYHNGRTEVRGADRVVDYVRENTGHLSWQHHNISPYSLEMSDDRARGRAYLISHQVIAADPSTVVVMTAHYDNEYVRVDGNWLIERMVHTITMTNFVPLNSTPPTGVDMPPAVQP